MKKLSVLVVAFFTCKTISFAQRGMNGITIRADIGLPIGDFGEFYKTGFGGHVMGKFGVGTAGQISLRSGYMTFTSDIDNDFSTNVIPVMAGYRHNLSGFYVHPELGIGMIGSKYEGGESEHESRFAWAIGAGFGRRNLDIGARYEKISTGTDDVQFSFIGLHLGYTFSF